MTDTWTPAMRALVAATLFLATATLMLVTVSAARAAGAPALANSGALAQAHDFPN